MEEQKCISVRLDFQQYLAQVKENHVLMIAQRMFQPESLWRQSGLSWVALNMKSRILAMVCWPIMHVDLAVGPDGTAVRSVGWLLSPNKIMVEVSSSLAACPLCVCEASGEMQC